MFKADKGSFKNTPEEKYVDYLKNWSLKYFEEDLKKRPSLHRYIKTLPKDVIEKIDKLRYSTLLKDKICKQFNECNIIPLKETDEIYISHVNYDKGGDQGLFDKHYDGTSRFVKYGKVVRSLIYISSSGKLKVVFDDSKKKFNFKTYEYGLLDFHNEYHWVEGKSDPNDEPRILLKCTYLICEKCNSFYKFFIKKLNLYIFYLVKGCMEYSKSPKNLMQRIIGFFCNFFRIINNISPILSMFVVLLLFILIIYLIYLLIIWIISIKIYQKIKKVKRSRK